ncbi:hypothetical protein MKY41_16480 [Sporosarcina sp. FSL W7-1349]|uniref:hypothetical protein n=1 Tax=Sporosarcina sp. FSL W7-1349 TaxID=2921561 RepID=UPI0030F94CDC
MKQKWTLTGPKLIAFAVFLFLIYINYGNWQEHRAFMDEAEQHPMEKRVVQKYVVLDLLEGPRYSFQLDAIPKSRVPKPANSSLIGVDREQYEQVEVGDTITGYAVEGKFYTDTLLQEEEMWFYLLLALFSLYPIGYILYVLLKIKPFRQLFERPAIRKFVNAIGNVSLTFLFYGVLAVLLLFGGIEWKDALANGYEKFFGESHTKTTALVIDRGIDHNPSLYGDHEYYLTLMYKPNSQENLFVAKGVTWHTYNKYQDEMPIVYNTQNPYQVFAQEMDFMDIFYISLTDTVTIMVVSLILTILLSVLPYLLWKRKKRKNK